MTPECRRNTEEDEVINCPWIDCLLKGESDELSSSGIRNYNKDSQCNENMDFNSDREPTSDESSWEDYGACSDDLEIILKEGAPAVPRTEFQTQIRNVTICRKENSSVGSGTDGRNSDIGDLADFSADEEESTISGPVVNVNPLMTWIQKTRGKIPMRGKTACGWNNIIKI